MVSNRVSRVGVTLILAVAPPLVAPGPSASAAHQCGGHSPVGTRCARTNVLIEHRPHEDRLVGDVNSHMRWCVRNRTIVLRKVRDGQDKTLVKTKSGRRGWFAFALGDWHGRFCAAARFKERTYGIDGHDMCWRGRSDAIRLS